MPTSAPQPRTRVLLRPLGLALAALAIFATACGDSGTNVSGDPEQLSLEVSSGDGQIGVEGLPLREPIFVRVLGPDGLTRSDVPIQLSVLEGDGRLTVTRVESRADGLAPIRFVPLQPGAQRIQAAIDPTWLPPTSGPVAVEVSASALAVSETDVIVARGALGPLLGVVLLKPFAVEGLVEIDEEWGTTDTIIPLYPRDAGSADVFLFAQENRLTFATPDFTPGADTIELVLQPRLPLAIHIENRFDAMVDGTSPALEAIMEQMDTMDRIWAEEGLGITVGEVTVEDLYTGVPVAVQEANLCAQPPADTWVISMVEEIENGRYTGYGCFSGRTWMARSFQRFPQLLAHEFGHTFSLPHTGTGVMVASNPGSTMTTGEAFQANFDTRSALNRLLDAQDPTRLGNCFQSRPDNGCLPPAYELPVPIAR